MPAPTNADELLDLLQKSNLVDEAKLRAYVQKLRDSNSLPSDPNKLAGVLVRDAILTYFQAEQLLQGKYKRFTLGKYKVLERLGSGGMGHVFLCEHKLMRRRVAVKVLPVPKAEDKASLDRFFREAKAAAAVDHPNIVRAYDIDQDENLHFIVMEWVDGTNLQDLVKKFGPLDVLRACHYVYGAAVGLQHANEIGLVHRDIKPGNILIDRSGVVKILDMGLARLTQDKDDNLTRMNDENVLGTADYLAPEQALDSHTVDIRADIYSLGATFYFLLTGRAPFPDGSVAQKLIWHQNRTPQSLKSLRSEVPDEVVAIVEKMMAKKPDDRYQTPADVMAALSGWVATPIPPPAEREMPPLSPAVAGERSSRQSAVPAALGVVRPIPTGPTTLSGLPTIVAGSNNTPAPATVPVSAAVAQAEPAVWATLGGDTQSGERGDTDRPEPSDPASERSSRVRRRTQTTSAGQSRNKKLVVYAAAGVLFVVGVAVGVYFAFFNGKDVDQPPGVPAPPGARKIVVTRAGGENAVGSLREALGKATPGDTIVIADAKITEPMLRLDTQKHKGLTIESGTSDGKPAVIEFVGKPDTPGFDKTKPMFEVPVVDGLKVRNVEFDARGALETCVQVTGSSPGVTFENVTVRGAQKAGFRLLTAAGEAGRPITLDRVRVLLTPTTDGVVSHVAGSLENKFILIKNSRFEGPGKSGIRLEGSTVDLEVSNNRFYNMNAALALTRPNAKPTKGVVTNNTVYQAQVGLLFDVPEPKADPKTPEKAPPPPTPITCELQITFNYFAHTRELFRSAAKVTGLVPEHNLREANASAGSPPLTATQSDVPPLPAPNPDQDATFLRFPADKFPTAGPKKDRVGANPP